MKKILIALLLLMPFQTGAVTGNATVFNPDDGSRKVVSIGDPSAFDDGYILEVARAVTMPEGLLGFSVVTDYAKNLSASMNSTQSTVPVTSMSTKDEHTITMADLGSKVFLVIEPGARKEEIVMCTGISGTNWTGCTRGLAFYGTSTAAVSANQMTHNSGSSVIISNTHYVYDENVDKDTAETITGVKTFTVSPIVPSPTTATQAANKTYVDNVAQQGGATSTESVVGISQLATQAEQAGNSFDSDNPQVISTKYASSTCASNFAVISESDSKISQCWIDLTEDFSFTGDISVTGTTTIATATVDSLIIDDVNADNLVGNSDASTLHYHPISCETGTFTREKGTTGNEVISHSLGVAPTYFNVASTGDLNTADLFVSNGMATSTANEQSIFSGSGDVDSGLDTTHIIYANDGANTFSATLAAITTTTFTLNIDVNSNTGTEGTRNVIWTVCK